MKGQHEAKLEGCELSAELNSCALILATASDRARRAEGAAGQEGGHEQRKWGALGTRDEPRGKKNSLDWAVSQREAETEYAPG